MALVGESGSGKSTLLRVLAGLYPADRGTILVDGESREGVRHLSGIATLIPQDPEIFEASLRRNLTMGLDYPPDALAKACELACLTSVIARLPAGMDSFVSERGVSLSGGQKQRLALARGILAARDSTILLLDEPTSSLDPATEARIYENLAGQFSEACILSSLHRLHLLERFDEVVLMEDGKIVDTGPPHAILERHPGLKAAWRRALGQAPEEREPNRAA